jgi:hypothetical protein
MFKLPIGPSAPERFKRAKKRRREYRNSSESGEVWTKAWGEYSTFYDDDRGWRETESKRSEVGELWGFEKVLLANINSKLKTATQDHPVIVLDFGGMFGLSFMRVAKMLEVSVSEGKLRMLVTNLNKPTENLERVEFPRAIKEFIAQNKHLLEYISADAGELQKKKISSKTGREIPLKGNIDFIHESFALEHGMQNDVDLPVLGSMLNEGGIFFTQLRADGVHPVPGLSPTEEEARQEAHRIGFNSLTDMGLKKITTRRKSTYRIFRGEKSSLVE